MVEGFHQLKAGSRLFDLGFAAEHVDFCHASAQIRQGNLSGKNRELDFGHRILHAGVVARAGFIEMGARFGDFGRRAGIDRGEGKKECEYGKDQFHEVDKVEFFCISSTDGFRTCLKDIISHILAFSKFFTKALPYAEGSL